MKKEKAINILKQQSKKLEKLNLSDIRNWDVETKTYLSEFFGKESHQYKHFDFNLTDPRLKVNKDRIINFFNDCCNIIENKGLYKPPKQNILNRIPDWSVIPIITGLFFIGGIFGRYQKDVAFIRMEKRIEILKDSIITISTNNISNKIKNHTNKPK